jgi:hypothetical protein
VKVYETAQAANRTDELKVFIPPRDRSLQGTSSFINLFLNRDSRPGRPLPLISISGIRTPRPAEAESTLVKAERGGK